MSISLFLALQCLAHSNKAAPSCDYKPKVILYEHDNPKLYQVPAKPNMSVPLDGLIHNQITRMSVNRLRHHLLKLHDDFNLSLPHFHTEKKIDVMLRLFFRDGLDILNFLYNTPDEPCLLIAPSLGQTVFISGSRVALNYLNVVDKAPGNSRYEESHLQSYGYADQKDNVTDRIQYKPSGRYISHYSTSTNYNKPTPTTDYRYRDNNFYTVTSKGYAQSTSASDDDRYHSKDYDTTHSQGYAQPSPASNDRYHSNNHYIISSKGYAQPTSAFLHDAAITDYAKYKKAHSNAIKVNNRMHYKNQEEVANPNNPDYIADKSASASHQRKADGYIHKIRPSNHYQYMKNLGEASSDSDYKSLPRNFN